MPLKTVPFDGSEYLDDDASQAELILDAVESGDATYLAHALGVVARARGMTSIAEETGVPRKAIYKALSDPADLDFATLRTVAETLGMKFKIEARSGDKSPSQAAE